MRGCAWLRAALALACIVLPAGVATGSAAAAVSAPPPHAAFSYQIGGPFRPAAGVQVVDRDWHVSPAAGVYGICYVNAFQAQPEELAWWRSRHRSLLLRRRGRPVVDTSWNEQLLDTSTPAKRRQLADIIGGWIDSCARAGYRAVEPDNLDSWSRSHGALTVADNFALAGLLIRRAHAVGLAIAQKNAAGLSKNGRRLGFDFAIAEECQPYRECASYLSAYGDRVIEIEYPDDGGEHNFQLACRLRGDRISVVYRDRNVTPAGRPGFIERRCPPAAARAAATTSGLAVLGFQSEDSPQGLIDRNVASLTAVGVDGVNLGAPGNVSTPDQMALGQLARARTDGLPAVLLVGNWSQAVNDFSERRAHLTLRSPTAVASAASELSRDALSGGWNGVSVDLESLAPRDRDGLTQFVADLRADLPAADSLTVCVEAFTTQAQYRANGYDLPGLAASADQIVLMTYDDHGPWENTPGPIGPLRWQRAAVRALEQVVPPSRVYLGVADYGYAWRPHSNDNLSVAQARALVARWHVRPRWVAAVGEWTAKLRDGSVLWWSDARSIARRIELARALSVHGIAVWSLGSGDPIPAGCSCARAELSR